VEKPDLSYPQSWPEDRRHVTTAGPLFFVIQTYWLQYLALKARVK